MTEVDTIQNERIAQLESELHAVKLLLENKTSSKDPEKVKDAETMEESKELSLTVEKLKKSLIREIHLKDSYSSELESTKLELQSTASNNSALKQHLMQVTSEAQKLLDRVVDLDERNESMEQENRELQMHFVKQKEELSLLQQETRDLRATNSSLLSEKLILESRLEESQKLLQEKTDSLKKDLCIKEQKLSEALEIATTQSEAFSQLTRKNIQLQQERDAMAQRESEFNGALLGLSEEFRKERFEKEENKLQLAQLKEQMASITQELLQTKASYERKIADDSSEYGKVISDLKTSLHHAEKKYEALVVSHTSLANIIFVNEQKALAVQEQLRRSLLHVSMVEVVNDLVLQSLQYVRNQCQLKDDHILQITNQLSKMEMDFHDAKNQLLSSTEDKEKLLRELAQVQEAVSTAQKQLAMALENSRSSADTKMQLENDNRFLKNQVDALTKELNEVDAMVYSRVAELQDINDSLRSENKRIRSEAEKLGRRNENLARKLGSLEEELERRRKEFTAQSKALELVESDLIVAKNKEHSFSTALLDVNAKLENETAKASGLLAAKARMECTIEGLQNKLKEATERFNHILTDKRRESESLRERLAKCMELAEKHESSILTSNQTIQNYETDLANLKNSNAKLKAKCAQDSESLKSLLSERESLARDRDTVVEKYNALHKAYSNAQKDATARVAEEMKKMLRLCAAQEDELQKLRRENIVFKKSLSMFVTSPPPAAETVFTERLNLTEGPRRHPKKRAESLSS